jgi:hypothetical protein
MRSPFIQFAPMATVIVVVLLPSMEVSPRTASTSLAHLDFDYEHMTIFRYRSAMPVFFVIERNIFKTSLFASMEASLRTASTSLAH